MSRPEPELRLGSANSTIIYWVKPKQDEIKNINQTLKRVYFFWRKSTYGLFYTIF